jgi:hypothetical protein
MSQKKLYLFLGLGMLGIVAIVGLLIFQIGGFFDQTPRQTNTVLATSPQDGAREVPIDDNITITFADAIPSASLVKLVFTPALPNVEYSILTKFPAATITFDPLGLMGRNTSYTVRVVYDGKEIDSFKFATQVAPPQQNDPGAVEYGEQITLEQYPLAKVTPYDSPTAYADYYAPFKMDVRVKSGTKEAAKAEIDAWMIKNGVNPSTHTLNFVGE